MEYVQTLAEKEGATHSILQTPSLAHTGSRILHLGAPEGAMCSLGQSHECTERVVDC